jgi:hypothetical protein
VERYIFLFSNGTSFVNFDAVTAVFRWKIGGKKSLYSANSCLGIHMLLYKQFRQLQSSVNGCMLFCLMMKETTRPYVIQSLQSSSIYLHWLYLCLKVTISQLNSILSNIYVLCFLNFRYYFYLFCILVFLLQLYMFTLISCHYILPLRPGRANRHGRAVIKRPLFRCLPQDQSTRKHMTWSSIFFILGILSKWCQWGNQTMKHNTEQIKHH